MSQASAEPAMGLTLIQLDASAFAAALPELLAIYASAMGYTTGVAQARSPLWLDHSRRIGFRCVVAVDTDALAIDSETPALAISYDDVPESGSPGPASAIVGFSYGYRGAIGQWWFNEVARGLGDHENPWLLDYFELTELHVRPQHQGHGTGEALLRDLVAPAPNRTILLSTPEGENRAWRLYRRLGFANVLRNFLFSGDGRPFAVLGRGLPLDGSPQEGSPHEGPPQGA
ncbi:MAG: GNAT family N-acetyltransferase [Nakamurella sp.]